MTRASDTRPVRREVLTRLGDAYVLEVGATTLTLRPKGTRSPRVRVTFEYGSLYLRGLDAQLDAERRARRRQKGTR